MSSETSYSGSKIAFKGAILAFAATLLWDRFAEDLGIDHFLKELLESALLAVDTAESAIFLRYALTWLLADWLHRAEVIGSLSVLSISTTLLGRKLSGILAIIVGAAATALFVIFIGSMLVPQLPDVRQPEPLPRARPQPPPVKPSAPIARLPPPSDQQLISEADNRLSNLARQYCFLSNRAFDPCVKGLSGAADLYGLALQHNTLPDQYWELRSKLSNTCSRLKTIGYPAASAYCRDRS